MTKQGWIWYSVLGIFYLSLLYIAFSFYQRSNNIRLIHENEELEASFEGNDWVTWENTEKGVIAKQVHPLPFYKPLNQYRVVEGVRLRSIDHNPIESKEEIDAISKAARPGKVFVATFEQVDPGSLTVETKETLFRNGFRLTFSFNRFPIYWHVIAWIVGIGAFVSLIMLTILIPMPIVRENWRENIPLIGIVVTALVFFLLQLMRHLYLIVESNLVSTGGEKIFIFAYCLLLFAYAIYYFYFKSESKSFFLALPALAVGGYFLYSFYDIIFIAKDLKYFHSLIESYSILFFLVNMAGGIGLFLTSKWEERSFRSQLGLLSVLVVSLLGIFYYIQPESERIFHTEHAFFLYNLFLFFPLINATFLQLQFGKVSLVVTQTIQYLVGLIVSIILYLLVIQLFDYTQPNIQYRKLLEFITFIILVVVLRLIYLSNSDKLSKYFVSSQQERMKKFKGFIARIPQFTSSQALHNELEIQLKQFFNADKVTIWQRSTQPESEKEKREHELKNSIYGQLTRGNTPWSKTKEISAFRLTNDLEKYVLSTDFTLICPITIDKDEYWLLMLGKKKRGVYNLSDLALISELIQQTQLTLNVLQLIQREKELIQQTYEANLTALRSQINPHFLFNTLNSISYLVHESPDLAEEAIEKLAFIFRYTLRMSSQNFVSLKEEMQLISAYLDLEKVRFGDRLDTDVDIDAEIKETQLPAFILSTLVENCIKHGISKILGKGMVSIHAFKEKDYMVCEVYDNGPGIDLSRIYKSHGLSNSIARLENIYDMKNLLHFENTGDGTLVRLKIPLAELSRMD
ncbi:MAG: histidine kinase [Bacteroidetes bacterium]|nr:histidine kinase [Bacteroidota bacterium]MCB0844704.1 histidine kinase [Bacteroidota bacterium]MCB0851362.1 histidine kinase [Bacteroidota bacterium]